MVLTLRLPPFCVYPQVLTGAPAVAHRCGASLFGAIPAADSTPL